MRKELQLNWKKFEYESHKKMHLWAVCQCEEQWSSSQSEG